jgi:lipopolysaccharide/colanic/teichoic acid biosynthesis glycosyltransferase
MCADADAESHRKLMKRIISQEDDRGETKLESDQRIFPFGLFLRKSSIDELPQLINILKGEMSLVGPRPCLPYEAEEYLHWHTRRFYTMPGLTGLWQVSGKNKLSFKQMIRLDISYEKRLSLILDIKILCRTIPAVMSIFFNSNE